MNEQLINKFKSKTNESTCKNQELEVNPTNEELSKHELLEFNNVKIDKNLFSDFVNGTTVNFEPLVESFLNSNKVFSKVKRSEIGKKVIDACDIDWEGYKILFEDITYKPKTTYELLDLIFRLLSYINYKINLIYENEDDIIWNNDGKYRLRTRLDWDRPEDESTVDWNNSTVNIETI